MKKPKNERLVLKMKIKHGKKLLSLVLATVMVLAMAHSAPLVVSANGSPQSVNVAEGCAVYTNQNVYGFFDFLSLTNGVSQLENVQWRSERVGDYFIVDLGARYFIDSISIFGFGAWSNIKMSYDLEISDDGVNFTFADDYDGGVYNVLAEYKHDESLAVRKGRFIKFTAKDIHMFITEIMVLSSRAAIADTSDVNLVRTGGNFEMVDKPNGDDNLLIPGTYYVGSNPWGGNLPSDAGSFTDGEKYSPFFTCSNYSGNLDDAAVTFVFHLRQAEQVSRINVWGHFWQRTYKPKVLYSADGITYTDANASPDAFVMSSNALTSSGISTVYPVAFDSVTANFIKVIITPNDSHCGDYSEVEVFRAPPVTYNFTTEDYNTVEDGGNLYITGVKPKTTIAGFKKLIGAIDGEMKVFKAGTSVDEENYVKTGTRVTIESINGVELEAAIIIDGDVNGDGLLNGLDIDGMEAHLLKSNVLAKPYLLAGNLSGQVTILELLALKEEVLIAETPVNLASGKAVTKGGGNIWYFLPKLLTDGDKEVQALAAFNEGSGNEYFIVDLASVYSVTGLSLCVVNPNDKPMKFSVSYSVTGDVYTPAGESGLFEHQSYLGYKEFSFDLNEAVTARYVKITTIGEGSIYASEFEVMGLR